MYAVKMEQHECTQIPVYYIFILFLSFFTELIFSAVSIRAAIAITICFSQKNCAQLIVSKMSFLYG